jgi:hypothetical protein
MTQEFKNTVKTSIKKLFFMIKTSEELTVASMILNAWIAGAKVTQRRIAEDADWIGVHPSYEGTAKDAGFIETSSRRVRQIVRDLRLKYGLPILSDSDGYYFPFSAQDQEKYIKRVEMEVAARNRASLETIEKMRSIFRLLTPPSKRKA